VLRRRPRHRHDSATHLTDQPPGGWRPPPPPPPPPPFAPPPYGGYPPPLPPRPTTNGLATTGFVCGLVGFIICLIPFGIFFGGIVAIVGIVFGFLGRSRAREVGIGRGMATTGAALGIVGLVIGIAWIFVFGSIFTKVRDNLQVHEGDFVINPQSCRKSQLSTVTAGGTITNTTTVDKLIVQVDVIVRDSSGIIVGEGQDFIGTVDAGETHAYFVTVPVDQSVSEPHCDVAVT
jgi:hypothetical protein